MDDSKLYGNSEDEVDLLVRTVWLFSQDIGMEFGVKKCAVVVMKSVKGLNCQTGKISGLLNKMDINILACWSLTPLSRKR